MKSTQYQQFVNFYLLISTKIWYISLRYISLGMVCKALCKNQVTPSTIKEVKIIQNATKCAKSEILTQN